MKSIEITAFLEGTLTHEAFYHELEHRIFENEPWKTLESDAECELEAFAYSTGIFFRVRTFSYDEQFLKSAFWNLAKDSFPKMSPTESRRFLKELLERKKNSEENFHERA